MHHVAIMKKSWNMIPKILSGEKTIESRWYQTRRAPWNGIKKGDMVFFKNAGEKVAAQARVSNVLQFELKTVEDTVEVTKKYGNSICLPESDPEKWGSVPRYCVLIFLEKPRAIRIPFAIDKKGFGAPAAWLTLKNINLIMV